MPNNPPPAGYDSDDEPLWSVDDIVSCKIIKGKPFFLVVWTGYGDKDRTWEPLEHVEHLEVFEKWRNSLA